MSADGTGPLTWARDWAEHDPDEPALVAPGLTLTSAELWDSALRISTALEAAGVQPGTLIALAGPAALRPVLALAALARGALGVGHGPGLPESTVVAFDRIAGIAPARFIQLDLAGLASQPPGVVHPGMVADPETPAMVVASSGTTGTPRLVLFTTTQLVRRVAAARATWLPDGAFASLLGPSSMSGTVAFLAALQRRAAHIVPGDAAANVAQLRDHRVEAVKGSPVQLAELLIAARREGEHLADLKLAESAGSPLSPALAREIAGWFGVEVVSLYGATEAGTVAVLRDPATARPGDAGHVLDGAEIAIVGDDGTRMPDGSTGRLRIRTAGVASGYLGDRAFGDGWFEPGDDGSVTAGRLRLDGRADDLLNADGVKVMPQRIEELVMRRPGVADAAACAVVDQHDVFRIALAVVGDAAADPVGLVAAVRPDLGAATPQIVVRLERVPRNDAGKVDRIALAELVQLHLRPRLDL
jgi:long-chain acyl-CoA synthetase